MAQSSGKHFREKPVLDPVQLSRSFLKSGFAWRRPSPPVEIRHVNQLNSAGYGFKAQIEQRAFPALSVKVHHGTTSTFSDHVRRVFCSPRPFRFWDASVVLVF